MHMSTILEHYFNGNDTVESLSDFSRAVDELLDMKVDRGDEASERAFFEAYDTRKFTAEEYGRAMIRVSFRHVKPRFDPLGQFRPVDSKCNAPSYVGEDNLDK